MFPEELIKLDRWCVWKYVERNGRMTKLPINPLTGELAKSNDESTWADYKTACDVLNSTDADGLGFFFKPPYIGIDLDDISDDLERYRQNDIQDNIVSEFYEAFKSYGEISPSGNGLHIIVKGKIPGARRRKGDVEIYDVGRFFTITGNTLGKYHDIAEVSEKTFKRIYDKYLGEKKIVKGNFQQFKHDLSESEIVRSILSSKQADKFKMFMNGTWQDEYHSQSEADLAFANILAFWCARDFAHMDSLFRQSSLYRPKWDEVHGKSTYGEATLYKAINDTAEVYKPKREKPFYQINFNGATQKPKEYPVRSWDDTGNADRLMDRYGEYIKYSYVNKKFYIYDGSKWAVDNTGEIRKLIDLTVADLKNEKIFVPEGMDEEEAMKEFRKHIKRSRGTSAKKNMMDEVQHRTAILPEEFDQDDMLLNVQNGYLDLSSGEMKEHDKDKLFSRQANSEYTDKASSDVWQSFLNDIFAGNQEVIRYIQKAVGYSLTGSVREQKMFILHGKGRNGKSIFVEVLSDILGDYAMNIQAKTIMVKRNETVNNDIAKLQGARFVTSSEPNEGFRFDEGLIKQLTGGDKVTARFLYGEDFDFNPKFKIWVSTNHKPIVRGTDDGIWRRLVLIPFEVQIPEHKVDKDLKYKLLREAPAILDWALEGCQLWQKEGLKEPEKIANAITEYRTDMDVLEHFIDECCVVGEGESILGGELYNLYTKWADESGEYKMNKNNFGKKMKEKFESQRKMDGIWYLGLGRKELYPGLKSM